MNISTVTGEPGSPLLWPGALPGTKSALQNTAKQQKTNNWTEKVIYAGHKNKISRWKAVQKSGYLRLLVPRRFLRLLAIQSSWRMN
jgi:hypothetical protein